MYTAAGICGPWVGGIAETGGGSEGAAADSPRSCSPDVRTFSSVIADEEADKKRLGSRELGL